MLQSLILLTNRFENRTVLPGWMSKLFDSTLLVVKVIKYSEIRWKTKRRRSLNSNETAVSKDRKNKFYQNCSSTFFCLIFNSSSSHTREIICGVTIKFVINPGTGWMYTIDSQLCWNFIKRISNSQIECYLTLANFKTQLVRSLWFFASKTTSLECENYIFETV